MHNYTSLTIQSIYPNELQAVALQFGDVFTIFGFFIAWVLYAIAQNWRNDV
jgi:hypothetical protein